jgi:hypothetical protein
MYWVRLTRRTFVFKGNKRMSFTEDLGSAMINQSYVESGLQPPAATPAAPQSLYNVYAYLGVDPKDTVAVNKINGELTAMPPDARKAYEKSLEESYKRHNSADPERPSPLTGDERQKALNEARKAATFRDQKDPNKMASDAKETNAHINEIEKTAKAPQPHQLSPGDAKNMEAQKEAEDAAKAHGQPTQPSTKPGASPKPKKPGDAHAEPAEHHQAHGESGDPAGRPSANDLNSYELNVINQNRDKLSPDGQKHIDEARAQGLTSDRLKQTNPTDAAAIEKDMKWLGQLKANGAQDLGTAAPNSAAVTPPSKGPVAGRGPGSAVAATPLPAPVPSH